ncbi:hypothetical protein [Paenibacillus qinlingensis]|uniref:Adenine nucleotide alpha hydrolase (AANH) superfamily ATPase n=1 Tax=Paenibacillus qinlingensis TaxID=1837343 RepID=A0ABU1NX64_9BACL|nr:hypothetical protein [Paenibacillus qinlingensis]MDR6551884.1 putative adenine nucleotide alpha hydrolase (AANH) superfamily ATPase [Paenibacillus qinlingensis]
MFKKNFVILILFGTCLLLVGCNPSKDEVVQNLIPEKEWEYALHVFYYHEDVRKLGDELNRFQNSSPNLQKGFQVQLWDHDQERNKKWAHALGIKKFPTYLILNKDGIVLQTQDMEMAKKYLTEH